MAADGFVADKATGTLNAICLRSDRIHHDHADSVNPETFLYISCYNF